MTDRPTPNFNTVIPAKIMTPDRVESRGLPTLVRLVDRFGS